MGDGVKLVENPGLHDPAAQRLAVRDLGMEHHHRVAGNEAARKAQFQLERELFLAHEL